MKALTIVFILAAVCSGGSIEAPQPAKAIVKLAPRIVDVFKESQIVYEASLACFTRSQELATKIRGLPAAGREKLIEDLVKLEPGDANLSPGGWRSFVAALPENKADLSRLSPSYVLGSLTRQIEEAVEARLLENPVLSPRDSYVTRIAGVEVGRVTVSGPLSALQWIAKQGNSEAAFVQVRGLSSNPRLLAPRPTWAVVEQEVVQVVLSDPLQVMKVVKSVAENPGQGCTLQGKLCVSLDGTRSVSISLSCAGGPSLSLTATGRILLDSVGQSSFSFSVKD